MIEFMLKDRPMRLIDGVFYARAMRNGKETLNQNWYKVSFHESDFGYIRCSLKLDGIIMKLTQHRMVWYAYHQDWDIWDNRNDNQIDHKNKIRNDNRIANLRQATQSENEQNKNSKGYYIDKYGKCQATIRINGKTKYLGRYDTEEEAREAYLQAKRELHPFFVENEEL